jgi:hypothetical protein
LNVTKSRQHGVGSGTIPGGQVNIWFVKLILKR